jgi:catechol 2,3-dioxygenase-like lactoylglutathione lyase family enzyme
VIVERTDFVSVPVRDLEKSTSWYRDTLGVPQVSEGGWPEFQLGENVSLYLIDLTKVGRKFTEPHTAYIALRVSDVEEARKELEGRGIEFEGDIFDSGVCHMAFFNDPDGNSLMLHRHYAPHDQG